MIFCATLTRRKVANIFEAYTLLAIGEVRRAYRAIAPEGGRHLIANWQITDFGGEKLLEAVTATRECFKSHSAALRMRASRP